MWLMQRLHANCLQHQKHTKATGWNQSVCVSVWARHHYMFLFFTSDVIKCYFWFCFCSQLELKPQGRLLMEARYYLEKSGEFFNLLPQHQHLQLQHTTKHTDVSSASIWWFLHFWAEHFKIVEAIKWCKYRECDQKLLVIIQRVPCLNELEYADQLHTVTLFFFPGEAECVQRISCFLKKKKNTRKVIISCFYIHTPSKQEVTAQNNRWHSDGYNNFKHTYPHRVKVHIHPKTKAVICFLRSHLFPIRFATTELKNKIHCWIFWPSHWPHLWNYESTLKCDISRNPMVITPM